MCPNCTDMRYLLLSLLLASGLTASAQVPDYVPTDGLVAWYPFSGNADDQSGNELNGSVNGAVLSSDRHGFAESAYYFGGNFPQFIALPELNANLGQPGSQTSISLWFRPEENPLVGSGQLIHASHQGYPEIFARVEVTQMESIKIYHRNSITNNEPIGGVSPFGEWSFLCALIDQQSGSYNMWLNGDLLESIDFSYDPSESYYSEGRSWEIGAISEALNYHQFKGAIDDVTVHNRILSEAEIAGLYMAEPPNPGCTDLIACNYNPEATWNDASCEYGCLNCGPGTIWDASIQLCVIANPSDTDFDGCVSMTDLLDLLSVFGTCNETPWSCGDPLEYQGYDYETVQIGEQCWFAENLRVDSFRNGDDIPELSISEDWSITETPAFATNFNIPADHFYNWHAVLDERSLCPIGWHMPFQGEVELMIEELGGHDVAGIHLKADSGWLGDGNGSNSSGFTGLPSGEKSSDGSFDAVGYRGYWWLQPFLTDNTASMRLKYNNDYVVFHNNIFSMNTGRNVRCIQDPE